MFQFHDKWKLMTKYRNNKSEKRKLKNYIYFYEKWKLVTKYRNKNKSDDLKPKKLFLISWEIKANDKISKSEKP